MNPLKELEALGQSVWLDYIRRDMFESGELRKYVDEDGLSGLTSNPAIFEKAITGSKDYVDAVRQMQEAGTTDPMTLFEGLAVPDIQHACDVMNPVYERAKRQDGCVSLEVSPYRARDTQGTIADARRLWKAVNRPNVMIKVPGTPEGIPAFETLISEGINVNVTLLFSNEAYEQVALAYIAGLEKHEGDLSGIASVASFFVSRIDALIDPMAPAPLRGKVAIANAKLAYQRYKEIFSGARWDKLRTRGAQPQRLLWASTSTKNPAYRDVMYCEELIGPMTVNTMPPATFDAFRDHGKARLSLEENIDAAHAVMNDLEKAGVSMKAATDKLLIDGLKLFSDAFDKLLGALQTKNYKLPADIEKQVQASLDEWKASGKVQRMWAGDASLWTGADESKWLGWLNVTEEQIKNAHHFDNIMGDMKTRGFTDAVLLGMGGSSLGVEVMAKTFGSAAGFPKMHVLDSTDPAQVKAIEAAIDPDKTLFIVASKSGSTLEPNIFKQYFFKPERSFVAITDPGSKMEEVAKSDNFRAIAYGLPSIGGRYSILSDFGMVPSSFIGIDVKKFLMRTQEMVEACKQDGNPGVVLGTILGTLAKNGRDKVTIVASPSIEDLGAWLEQLLAESTGKDGKGLIPVDRETLGAPSVYGNDRVFVYERYTPHPDPTQDAAIAALEQAGHPVVRLAVEDRYDLGQEFFRWEIATATAGAIIGINPFNQPDVEASKIATKKLTSEYEKNGSLPAETPIFEDAGIKIFAEKDRGERTLAGCLKNHLDLLKPGDYFALLGYIQMNLEHEKQLQAMRMAVRDAKKVATCLGFGPRFLHSTGQAYKGGPNSGVFLQITCDDAVDVPVPGQKFTFGVVKAAQARGDLQVLTERKRRALRVHLGKDVDARLATLAHAIGVALH